MKSFDIYYVDTLQGGSGLTRMSADANIQDLALWLAARPGCSIWRIVPIGGPDWMTDESAIKDERRNAIRQFAHQNT